MTDGTSWDFIYRHQWWSCVLEKSSVFYTGEILEAKKKWMTHGIGKKCCIFILLQANLKCIYSYSSSNPRSLDGQTFCISRVRLILHLRQMFDTVWGFSLSKAAGRHSATKGTRETSQPSPWTYRRDLPPHQPTLTFPIAFAAAGPRGQTSVLLQVGETAPDSRGLDVKRDPQGTGEGMLSYSLMNNYTISFQISHS